MPIVFINRNPMQGQTAAWRSVMLDANLNQYVWTDTNTVVGADTKETGALTLEKQVGYILGKYAAFRFIDSDYADIRAKHEQPTAAEKLNLTSMQPDFTQETLERGWVSPTGDFVGCASGCHAPLAVYTLGLTRGRKHGWIMIQPDFYLLCCKNTPVLDAQIECLRLLGFSGSHDRQTIIPEFTSDVRFTDSQAHVQRNLLSTDSNIPRPIFLSHEKAAHILLSPTQDHSAHRDAFLLASGNPRTATLAAHTVSLIAAIGAGPLAQPVPAFNAK